MAASAPPHTPEGRSGLHISMFITKGQLKLGSGPRALLGHSGCCSHSLGTSMESHKLATPKIKAQSSSFISQQTEARIRKRPSKSPLASYWQCQSASPFPLFRYQFRCCLLQQASLTPRAVLDAPVCPSHPQTSEAWSLSWVMLGPLFTRQ